MLSYSCAAPGVYEMGGAYRGQGHWGSLLLTGAKKPEIVLPTERCTISRQQRQERNGFRYKT